MKYIWLGIKDYCKDIYHDWVLKQYWKFYKTDDYPTSWKEGSVFHYINQRKLAKSHNVREWVLEEYIKSKQDFIYYIWAALDEISSNGATYEWFVNECNYLCKIAKKRGWLK